MCDLQSMLHKTLPHLTVITLINTMRRPLGLLFCLLAQVAKVLTAWPKSGELKTYPRCALKNRPSGKGERTELEEALDSRAPFHPAAHAQVLEGDCQQHRRDLFAEEGGWRSS